MKMIKCIRGHRYNTEIFTKCPYCDDMESDLPETSAAQGQEDVDTEEPGTVKQQVYEIVGRRKVVGSLLCIRGNMTGQGFFLVEGQNDIGRIANLEVVLTNELTVSRKPHASIVYERENNSYMLVAAEGKKDVFCRDKLVKEPLLLKNGDIIQIGECTLRFYSFCDDVFSWA